MFKIDKKKIIISEKSTIWQAMTALNEMPLGLVVLVDEKERLLGILTDGDIRRALANGTAIDSPAAAIMNKNPVASHQNDTTHRVLCLFNEQIRQVPVIDDDRRVVDVLLYSEFAQRASESKRSVTVRCKAPLRISFAGGGTDMSTYIKGRTGSVLSTTINKYCHATLVKRDDRRIVIHSLDYETRLEMKSIDDIHYDGHLDLIKAVIKLMRPDFGMELHLSSDVPPRTGLGGSSAAATATTGVLNYFREEKLDDYQIAEIAFQAERVELRVEGGWQDQYASVFGGFNFMEFRENDVFIHPLRLKQDMLNELEANLLLCAVNQTRDVITPKAAATPDMDALNRTGEFAIQMRNLLLKGDFNRFGEVLHSAWEAKKQNDRNATNERVDSLYSLARANGAVGGKMLGAGGGGYMLFFCPPLLRYKVQKSLRDAGAQVVDFNFENAGLQTWSIKAGQTNGGL